MGAFHVWCPHTPEAAPGASSAVLGAQTSLPITDRIYNLQDLQPDPEPARKPPPRASSERSQTLSGQCDTLLVPKHSQGEDPQWEVAHFLDSCSLCWGTQLARAATAPGQGQFSSIQFSCSVVSDSLRPHRLQHARLPCPSPAPGAYSNSRPSS